ncbi:hypothetical protein K435DRAFT_630418, partial [Dendrothele bispora CBS 962.96]
DNALAHLYGFTVSVDLQSPLRVFTAGVCYNQSSPLVKAGAGIFFGPGSKFNASSRVPGPSLSSERAHTYAVWQAIKDFPRNRPLIIYTSPYVIKALTAHSERNTNIKWSGANGDIFKNIIICIQSRLTWLHLSPCPPLDSKNGHQLSAHALATKG